MRRTPPSLAILLTLAACGTPTANEPPSASPVARPSPATTDLEELHAFARLYGYVRFFHPSDEAAALDWDGFAIHGVQQVTAARTRDELVQTLEALFLPVAPTLDVHLEGEAPRDLAALLPADATGLDVVAWQHLGYGFGDMVTAYASSRTHRRRQVAEGFETSSAITQELDAEPLRGKRIRLRGYARVDPAGPTTTVRPSIRIEVPAGVPVRRVGSLFMETQWTALEVEVDVPADAKEITVGLTVGGQGAAWLDDVSVERQEGGAWQPVALDNPGFEADAERPRKWDTGAESFEHRVGPGAHGGERALRVARKRVLGQELAFDTIPSPRERFAASLGAGLRVQLPLALYSQGDHTLGPPGAAATPALPELSKVPRAPEHPAVRTAAVVVAWNVFQHFYPYFDVVDTDWEAVLDQTLADVADDATPQDTHRTLRRMVAQLHDGHGNVMSPVAADESSVTATLGWVEGKIVVLAVPKDSPLQRGDVVVRIDGEDALAKLDAELAYASGSLQWKRHRLLAWGALMTGPTGTKASIEVLRGDQALALDVERRLAELPPVWDHEPIEALPGGFFYIDLGRAEWTAIFKQLETIAKAPGVVFDLRGYPNGTDPVLRHLLTAPEQDKWMQVPKIVYPDHAPVSEWQEIGWDMAPAPPHIEGKVAFITGGGAISYAESVMGYVEGLRLGEIVGGPTAGANGNVNPFTTPGGYTIYWTGMKVRKHDGSTHHAVGVQPTIPAEPTVAGIREGRDELFERALEAVGGHVDRGEPGSRKGGPGKVSRKPRG